MKNNTQPMQLQNNSWVSYFNRSRTLFDKLVRILMMILKFQSSSLNNMKLEANIKDTKNMEWEMAMGSSFINRDHIMMGNGETIKCMALADCTILIISLLTREIGMLICFVGTALFTMIAQLSLKNALIIQIWISSKIVGSIIREGSKMTKSKDMGR